jgi:hypothetical protein
MMPSRELTERSIQHALDKLADIRKEQQRQMQYAGERFGVSAKLRELGREERRLVNRIERLRGGA